MLTGTVLTRRRFPNAAISYVVLKHEGNMPFENDGLRWGSDGHKGKDDGNRITGRHHRQPW